MRSSLHQHQVILIEFNELCPTLLDKWIADGSLPNFARFRDDSAAFVTQSDELEPPNLEPWIQWYSVHTGLGFSKHHVFHLTDGPRAGHEDIWRYLSKRGHRVGNFGSMNARSFAAPGSFFVADPWCSGEAATPAELNAFQGFVARQVKEYTRADLSTRIGEALDFGAFMLGHGLSANTTMQFARRLVAEKTWDRQSEWKRATLLDRLQLDVFLHYFKKHQPSFATFFSNSTAHFQHAYWRHMDPAPFTIRPSEEEMARYSGAVLYGYKQMDELLGRLLPLEQSGVTLVLATALSQQPFLRLEAVGGQRFYRPRNVKELMRKLGVEAVSIEPTMTHQFNLICQPGGADQAHAALAGLRLGTAQVFHVEKVTDDQIYFGCSIRNIVQDDASISHERLAKDVRFYDEFYLIDGMKSGCHHPDGIFWIKNGYARQYTEKVSILDIFPTLTNLVCGGDADWRVTSEGHDRIGRNLLSEPDLTAAAAE